MEDRGHELCILLIGGIIGQLSKPLVIQRFPDETIEQSALLRDPGTQRIKIILRTDHLRAGRDKSSDPSSREHNPVHGQPKRWP